MSEMNKIDSENKEFNKILSSFLVEAKIKAYASGIKYKTTQEGLNEFEYQVGNYRFKDTYFGHYAFSGIEIIWHKEEPIWAMNYFGSTDEEVSKNSVLTSVCYSLLRQALSMVGENNPFRGPKSLISGKWEYKNNSKGKISRFFGKESILYKGKEVYNLAYFGGFSKGKE